MSECTLDEVKQFAGRLSPWAHLATVGADYLSHPSHFAGKLGEAVATGLVAGALSLVVGRLWKAFGRSAVETR